MAFGSAEAAMNISFGIDSMFTGAELWKLMLSAGAVLTEITAVFLTRVVCRPSR